MKIMTSQPQTRQGALQMPPEGRSRPGTSQARLLVSPDGRVLFSDRPLAELFPFVDPCGRVASERALHLLRWVHAGYVSESSSVRIPDAIPEHGDRLEVTVRPSPVTDIYILQAVVAPHDP